MSLEPLDRIDACRGASRQAGKKFQDLPADAPTPLGLQSTVADARLAVAVRRMCRPESRPSA